MNTLPDLPRQHKKKEAEFGIKLKEWFEENPRFSCGIETKQTNGKDYLSFSEVSEKQIAFGNSINSGKGELVRVQGLNGESDYIWCYRMPALILIKYPKIFCAISVETFELERNRSKKKSLTSARAEAIAIFTVTLGKKKSIL